MSELERRKWDERYAQGFQRHRTDPSALLVSWLPRLQKGRALDVACGTGRNAIFLAQHGYKVDAIDISEVGLDQAQDLARQRGVSGVRWIHADLDRYKLPRAAYDVIVQSFYLNRALFPRILAALKAEGYLLMEQHLLTPVSVHGPQDPEFLLRPNELLRLVPGLRILFYQEGLFQEGDRTMAVARLVACKSPGGF